MKLLFKLFLLCAALAVLMPIIAPNSSISAVVRAAVADVSGFCERRPEACEEGARIAHQAKSLLIGMIDQLSGAVGDRPLTDSDRVLEPPPRNDDELSAQDRKSAFAGHQPAFSY